MRRHFVFAIFLTAGLSLLCFQGCKSAEKIIGSLKKPKAEIAGVHLGDFNIDAATLLFDVKVTNPYKVPLPLANVDYMLTCDNMRFLSGNADIQDTIPSGESKTVSIPAQINFMETLQILKQIKPGSIVPYTADLGMSVNPPGADRLRLPLSKSGELPIPAIPDVAIQEIRWKELSLDSASGVIRLNVANPNAFPFDLTKLSYALSLADVDVASAGIDQNVSFAESGGANTLEIPVSFSPRALGLAAFKMLMGDGAGYMLDGLMDVETPYGSIPMPLKASGKTLFKK